MISKSFIKSSFIYSVVGSLSLAASILLLPFYGNQDLLSTSSFGLLAVYIVFSELVRILFTFSVDVYLGTNFIHYSDTRKRQRQIIGTSALFLLIFGTGMTLLMTLSGEFVFDLVFPDSNMQFFPYGFLSVLTGLFRGIFKTYSNLMIYKQRPRPFFFANILTFVLTVSASIAGLYLSPLSLDGPIWGRMIGASSGFIWAIVFFVYESRLTFVRSVLKDLFRYSAPVFIYSILFWSISNIDRYFILGAFNEKQVAIFDFAIKMTMLVEFLQNGLSAAINPKIFRIWKNNNDVPESNVEINRYYNIFTLLNQLSIPLFFIAVVFGVPLLINNSDLYLSFNLLPILFAGMTTKVWYYYLITPIYYFKKTYLLPIIFAIVAVFQISLTYFLIQFFDIEGAAWANFATKVFQALILYVFVSRFFKIKVNSLKLIVFPLVYMLMLIVMQVWGVFINAYINNLIHFLLLFVMAVFLFRKEIAKLRWFIKND